ncbi:MAG: substrate-binding domain-containing protein, partial [Lachnospiraceae bacterium]|nr:substrate-binding domain-containing protein [Lachnospiraceae bacterium]
MRNMKKILAILLATTMVAGLTACGSSSSSSTTTDTTEMEEETETEEEEEETEAAEETTESSGLTFAIVPKSSGNPYNEKEASGFEEACEELGVECIIQYPEDTSAEAQITVINNLIAQGVDAIAIAANDSEALESTIETAKDAGITVVTLDSDAVGSQLFINQAGVDEVAQVLV